MTPQKFDVFTRGRSALQVSTGQAHFAVVTVEKELYTWATSQGGTEMVGQLGHGDTAAYKAPRKLSTLEGIPVKQAACGEDFTVIVTDEGAVYSFGSDYYGCLGCDNEEGDSVCTPVLVEFFNDKPVEQVSCGDAHVIALTKDGEVYTWGCGEFGRLGLGNEDDFALPQKVHIRGGKHGIRSVHAGPDGSFVIKTNGRVLACGSNEYNKLGFNSSARGLRKHKKEISYDIPCKLTFTTVKPLSKYHIFAVSAGTTHSAAIDIYGHLLVFGSNKYGQLGVGDFKERHGVNLITGALSGKKVVKVACGDGFTVISTSENQIYSWGQSENGRLGTLSRGEGRGPNGSCFALPRTIFGSLHVVSDVSSRYWNTILVAEKVLAQKTIRSTSVLQLKSGAPLVDSGLSDDEFHENCSSTASGARPKSADAAGRRGAGGISADSTAPAWLKLELREAEFIPVDSPGLSTADTSMEDSAVPDWLQQEICDAADPSQCSPGIVDIPPLLITSTPQDTSPDGPLQPTASTPNDLNAANYDLVDAIPDNLQAMIRQLQEENARIKETYGELVMENSTLRAENSNLKSQNEQLHTVTGEINTDSTGNETSGQNQAQEIITLSDENSRLTAENQKYSTEISSLSKQILKLTDDVTALENSKAIVEEQNAKLSYEIHELKKSQIKEN